MSQNVLENAIEQKFVEGVKKLGGKAYKFVSPGNAGVPDRLVVVPGGSICFCELKQAGKALTPRQQKCRKELENFGVVIVPLAGIGAVNDFLEQLKMKIAFDKTNGEVKE